MFEIMSMGAVVAVGVMAMMAQFADGGATGMKVWIEAEAEAISV